jgi:hypothetical protein
MDAGCARASATGPRRLLGDRHRAGRRHQEATCAHLRECTASTTLADEVDPDLTVVTDPLSAIRALKQEDGLDIDLVRWPGTLPG